MQSPDAVNQVFCITMPEQRAIFLQIMNNHHLALHGIQHMRKRTMGY